LRGNGMKAIALLSGGLDSILAVKVVSMQGVEIEAVHFTSVFHENQRDSAPIETTAGVLGVHLRILDISEDLFGIIKNPKHGYGSNVNPCIDCHAFMFKKAGEYMRETGASFLITGEVLGERPMSQKKPALRIVEKESGMNGLILRPLSAKLLEPTIPEQKGWVDREKLLAIEGRSRKPQIELARQFGINKYPTPAGGCLLTDPGFANRMRDLMQYKPDFSVSDVNLLKVGRLFRITKEAVLAVGRDKEENGRLLKLAADGDIFFYPVKRKGPTGLGRGVFGEGDILTASGIIARYSDKDSNASALDRLEIAHKVFNEKKSTHVEVLPMPEKELETIRI
ncbi:MAG: hypothetical protein PHI59_03275, partial [Candidatus Omnitrophica bacterium]|nr:hypothetical protein [Candidatus Omnitrophota bacterium]